MCVCVCVCVKNLYPIEFVQRKKSHPCGKYPLTTNLKTQLLR